MEILRYKIPMYVKTCRANIRHSPQPHMRLKPAWIVHLRGGGVSNSKPHKAFGAHEVCAYILEPANEVQPLPHSCHSELVSESPHRSSRSQNTSSRSGLRAEGGPVRSYTQTSAKEVQSMLVMSSRNRLRARQTKNFRLAGSQTKIRHKLGNLCENI